MEEFIELITSTTHELVIDNQNKYIVDANNQVLIRHKQNNELFYIALDDTFKEIFGYNVFNEIMDSMNMDALNIDVSTSSSQVLSQKNTPMNTGNNQKWGRSHILKLISLYEKYQKDFLSTTIKNEKFWKQISNEMELFTPKQCSDKFKYLKQKYGKKRDNMGAGSSGTELYKFEYFDEFENIFGKKPNINPIYLASSSRGDTVPLAECIPPENQDVNNEAADDNPSRRPSSAKKNSIDKLITYLKDKNTKIEDNRERKHQEKLAAFNKKIDLILEKLQ